jgi:membrane associated rhomboid family serine protease
MSAGIRRPNASPWTLYGLARLLVALLVATALPRGVAAQRIPAELLPPPGARVRVLTLSGDSWSGTLRAVVGNTMMLTEADTWGGRLTQRPVSVDHVNELWVSRGRRRGRGALYGFGIGLVGGAAIGASLGALTATETEDCDFCGRDVNAFFGAIGGAILGAPLGAVIGALHGPERWERRWPATPRNR